MVYNMIILITVAKIVQTNVALFMRRVAFFCC